MTWTVEQRRRYRQETYYDASNRKAFAGAATTVKVPEDVERVYVSEPCFMCGTARRLCKHRQAVAA